MEGIENYQEYERLFRNELVVAVRKLLKKAEDGDYYAFDSSHEHNAMIAYFNQYWLHKKLTPAEFAKQE